jgi:hypothetical protein
MARTALAERRADERSEPDGGHRSARDLDRELGELLQELRVMLPGVQVLLAFLLTVPFTQRFTTLSTEERALYFAAVVTTGVAIVLMMAPGIQHRIRFREHDKEALLQDSNRLVLVATVAVGCSLGLVVLLLAEYLYGWAAGALVTAFLLVIVVALWYVSPMRRRSDGLGNDRET